MVHTKLSKCELATPFHIHRILGYSVEEKISSLKERVDMLEARLACLEESSAGTSVGIEADIQGNVSHDMEVHQKLESL